MSDIPVYIDGRECGRLFLAQKGLMTELAADCEMTEGIVRLSVFGGGRSTYIGVLYPENGRLVLRKSLSREAMRAFPTEPEYAADRELARETKNDIDGLLWFSTPQGFLTAFDGRQSLIAIPSEIRSSPIVRIINGRQYAIFPAKRKV